MSGIPLSLRNHTDFMPPDIPPAPQTPINQALYTYREHQSEVSAVAWSPKNSIIASGDAAGTVFIWDAATGATLKSSLLQPQAPAELTAVPNSTGFFVRSLSWSPDGRKLAIAVGNGTVYIWDMRAKFPALVYSNLSAFTDAAWSPDGKFVVASDNHFNVLVWEVNTDHRPIVLQGHTDVVRAITWSPDSRSLAAGGMNGTIHIWDVASGKQMYWYPSTATTVYNGIDAVVWSPTGSVIAVSGNVPSGGNMPITLWSVKRNSESLLLVYNSPAPVYSIAWSPNGALIASSGSDSIVRIWEASSGQTSMIYTGHFQSVSAVAWSPDGQYVASGGSDSTVQVWSPYTTGT